MPTLAPGCGFSSTCSDSRKRRDFSSKAVGASSVYVITDDPDAVYERAVAGGAEITRGMEEADYGSRGSPSAIWKGTCSASGPIAGSETLRA